MSVISKDDYYLRIAQAVSARANCVGRKVGAVIVKADRIVATGYNGTAAGMPNCLEGGCWRCNEGREQGGGYDICSCVHAEGNALASAARFGVPLDGTTVYSTLQPCFSCAKELVQAGVIKVFFIKRLKVKAEVAEDYARLQQRLEAEQRTPDATELCPACFETHSTTRVAS